MLTKVAFLGENHSGREAMRGIFLPQNLSAEGNILGDIMLFCDIAYKNAGTPRLQSGIFMTVQSLSKWSKFIQLAPG